VRLNRKLDTLQATTYPPLIPTQGWAKSSSVLAVCWNFTREASSAGSTNPFAIRRSRACFYLQLASQSVLPPIRPRYRRGSANSSLVMMTASVIRPLHMSSRPSTLGFILGPWCTQEVLRITHKRPYGAGLRVLSHAGRTARHTSRSAGSTCLPKRSLHRRFFFLNLICYPAPLLTVAVPHRADQ
jgi:hypothetical protein